MIYDERGPGIIVAATIEWYTPYDVITAYGFQRGTVTQKWISQTIVLVKAWISEHIT